MKKPHKLDEKTKKKTMSLINKKPLNMIKKQGGKSIICCFPKSEKLLKPSKENRKENQILIEDRDKLCLKVLD